MKKAAVSRKKVGRSPKHRTKPAPVSGEKKRRVIDRALRRRAEKKLASRPKSGARSGIDALKLVHELQVHRIELEMQNEELRHANTSLEEARLRFSDLYDFAPAGYVALDEKGIVTEANLTFARMAGQERGFLLHKSFHSLVPLEDKGFFSTYFDRLVSSGVKTTFEIRIARRDGSSFDAQIETVGFFGQDKSSQQYLLAILDVSERKRLEDAVRHSEARLESLLKISQYQATSNLDLFGFALNQAITLTESKIGYIYRYDETRKEFTLDTWSKGVMEECTIAEKQTVYHLEKTGIWGEAVRQAGPIIVNDFHAPHPLKKGYPDGHSALNKFLTVPVLIEGRIVGVVGVANKETDYDADDSRQLTLLMDSAWRILERRRMEDQLREGEKQYRNLFESMVEGFALCEMIYDEAGKPIDFRYVDVNPAFARLTGLTVDLVIGRRVREVIPGIEPFWIETYGRIVESGRGERIDNPVAALGKHFELYAWRSEPGRFAVVFNDITDRVQREELLRIQSEDLVLANKDLEAFGFSVSHDLRNPLHSIGVCCAVIAKDLDTTMGKNALTAIQHILKSTQRMSQVITDLLALSSIARQDVRREKTNLSKIVDEFRLELTSFDPQREIEFVIEPDCLANVDAGFVRILIENLVRNAWKYTSKTNRAVIKFGAQKNDGQTIYSIRDNGVGFDMADVGKLFKPFNRLHSDNEFKGTGIGLAIVKRIIDKHHGSIWAEAKKGAGATFYFRLE
jgi:PAS domain S-box-containing protein